MRHTGVMTISAQPKCKPSKPLDLALIGAPTDAGAGLRGACLGPEALRIAGLQRSLGELGHTVCDHGDISGPRNPEGEAVGGCRNLKEVISWCTSLRDSVCEALKADQIPIILGGDHSISMGSVAGVATCYEATERRLHVLWLDAHSDFNTPTTSPSGNVHGMPVAAMCGQIKSEEFRIGFDGPMVDPSRIYLFGIRSVDAIERNAVTDAGINVIDMRMIDERGVVSTLREILREVAAADGHLHVSLDVDFIDPAIAPGVGTTVPGGATYREAHLCMEMIHESGLLGSLDLVELNPFLDVRGMSAELLVDLTGSLFGKTIIDRTTG